MPETREPYQEFIAKKFPNADEGQVEFPKTALAQMERIEVVSASCRLSASKDVEFLSLEIKVMGGDEVTEYVVPNSLGSGVAVLNHRTFLFAKHGQTIRIYVKASAKSDLTLECKIAGAKVTTT
jgi:hypothetical protein